MKMLLRLSRKSKWLLEEIVLVQLHSNGEEELERWVIKNPLITSVDFDTVDYSSDEMLNISVTIKYDFAYLDNLGTLKADGSGAGTGTIGEDKLWTAGRTDLIGQTGEDPNAVGD